MASAEEEVFRQPTAFPPQQNKIILPIKGDNSINNSLLSQILIMSKTKINSKVKIVDSIPFERQNSNEHKTKNKRI